MKSGTIDAMAFSPPFSLTAVADGGVMWVSGPDVDLPEMKTFPLQRRSGASGSLQGPGGDLPWFRRGAEEGRRLDEERSGRELSRRSARPSTRWSPAR